jgi:hypothetical protein
MNDGTDAVRSYPIDRVGRGGARADVERVTIEEPREIRIGGQTLAVTMRTPGHDFELAAGFLVAEGIVWPISTCIRASIASSPPTLDDGREDPGEEYSGDDEERNRDQERDPDSEAGEGGHGRKVSGLSSRSRLAETRPAGRAARQPGQSRPTGTLRQPLSCSKASDPLRPFSPVCAPPPGSSR